MQQELLDHLFKMVVKNRLTTHREVRNFPILQTLNALLRADTNLSNTTLKIQGSIVEFLSYILLRRMQSVRDRLLAFQREHLCILVQRIPVQKKRIRAANKRDKIKVEVKDRNDLSRDLDQIVRGSLIHSHNGSQLTGRIRSQFSENELFPQNLMNLQTKIQQNWILEQNQFNLHSELDNLIVIPELTTPYDPMESLDIVKQFKAEYSRLSMNEVSTLLMDAEKRVHRSRTRKRNASRSKSYNRARTRHINRHDKVDHKTQVTQKALSQTQPMAQAPQTMNNTEEVLLTTFYNTQYQKLLKDFDSAALCSSEVFEGLRTMRMNKRPSQLDNSFKVKLPQNNTHALGPDPGYIDAFLFSQTQGHVTPIKVEYDNVQQGFDRNSFRNPSAYKQQDSFQKRIREVTAKNAKDGKFNMNGYFEKRSISSQMRTYFFYQVLCLGSRLEQSEPAKFSDIFILSE